MSESRHMVTPAYQPRDPSGPVLYQVIADHLDTFLATLAADPTATGLPAYVATPRSAATSRPCCRSYCSSRRAATGSGAEKSRLKILSPPGSDAVRLGGSGADAAIQPVGPGSVAQPRPIHCGVVRPRGQPAQAGRHVIGTDSQGFSRSLARMPPLAPAPPALCRARQPAKEAANWRDVTGLPTAASRGAAGDDHASGGLLCLLPCYMLTQPLRR